MSVAMRARACTATLVLSFVFVRAAAAQEPAEQPAPPAPAEGTPATDTAPKPAADKPKPKPRPRPVVQPPAPKPKATADEIARLRRVEAALRGAGLLPAQDDASKVELSKLKEQLAKLEEQRRSLEAAVQGGLDAETVKPVLAGLVKKTEELKQRIAALEAEQPAAAETAVESPLSQRLAALEASVKAMQQPHAAATPTASKSPEGASTEPDSHRAVASDEPEKEKGKPAGRAGWKDGFFIESEDGKYSLKPSGFLDFKFAHSAPHGEDAQFAFSVPYARLAFKGNLFSKSLKYNVTTDFAKGSAVLTYFFGDYMFVPDYFGVRAGQQKRPFSRLHNGPSEKSQFISTSSAIKAFGDATDLGLVLHNNGAPRFEYSLGFFNGTSSKSTFSGDVVVDPMTGEGEVTSGAFSNVPARFQPALVGRVALNHGKIEGYSEVDFEGGPLRASLGAGSYLAFDLDRDDKSAVRATLDGLIKAYGLAINAAGFIGSKQKGEGFAERELEATGAVLQAGYLVTPHIEPVGRYSVVNPKGADNDTHELTVGLNAYFYKHSLKWQNDVGARIAPAADETTTDYLFESQLQLMF